MAALDASGTGQSTEDMMHHHSILSYVVDKAPKDGHTHALAAVAQGGDDAELDEGDDPGQIESDAWQEV
jgi:hypothetical protein